VHIDQFIFRVIYSLDKIRLVLSGRAKIETKLNAIKKKIIIIIIIEKCIYKIISHAQQIIIIITVYIIYVVVVYTFI